MQKLSIYPIDFAKKDIRGRNIAFEAALNEELGILYSLNDLRPDLFNELDKNNFTPISLALAEGRFRSARTLIALGADCRIGGGHLGSCLHLATQKMYLEFILKLLHQGLDPNQEDVEQNTPLHIIFSIFSKDVNLAIQISEHLMQHGSDPNKLNKDHWAPLHLAVTVLPARDCTPPPFAALLSVLHHVLHHVLRRVFHHALHHVLHHALRPVLHHAFHPVLHHALRPVLHHALHPLCPAAP